MLEPEPPKEPLFDSKTFRLAEIRAVADEDRLRTPKDFEKGLKSHGTADVLSETKAESTDYGP